MVLRALLIALFAGVALAFGWLRPPKATPPVPAVRPLGITAPSLRLDDSAEGEAALSLAGLHPPPAPPPGPPRPPAPPPAPRPPPPDAGVLLRAAVSAVVEDSDGLHLLLSANAVGGPRVLRTGDAFDGWRLTSISRHQAVMQRGGEQRVVAFFGAPNA